MKNLLLCLLFTIVSIGYTQTSPGLEPKNRPVYTNPDSLTKNDTKTLLLYEGDSVYRTKNDKYYVVRKSRKGNYYKYYLVYKP